MLTPRRTGDSAAGNRALSNPPLISWGAATDAAFIEARRIMLRFGLLLGVCLTLFAGCASYPPPERPAAGLAAPYRLARGDRRRGVRVPLRGRSMAAR